jgi:hypothetical protein
LRNKRLACWLRLRFGVVGKKRKACSSTIISIRNPFTKIPHARHLITLSRSSSLNHHLLLELTIFLFCRLLSILQIRPGKKQRTPNKCRWMCSKCWVQRSVHGQCKGNANMYKPYLGIFPGSRNAEGNDFGCLLCRWRVKTECPIILGLRRRRQLSHRQEPCHCRHRVSCQQ